MSNKARFSGYKNPLLNREERWRKPKKHRRFKTVSNNKGRETERRFFEAMREFRNKRPEWLLSIRRGTQKEDAQGIDGVASTDIGKIFIQIKSSEVGAQKFIKGPHFRRNKHIVIVVILYSYGPRSICKKAYEKISAMRRTIIAHQKA